MRVLRSFDKPQTIIICDFYHDNDFEPSAMVTDDESSFKIRSKGGPTKKVDCFGFVHILTQEEFIEYYESLDNYDDDGYGFDLTVVLNNFVGDICVTSLDENGEENDNFELDDYMEHQFEEYHTMLIEVPEGYIIEPMEYIKALDLIKSGDSVNSIVKYLIKTTTNFVSPKGEWDLSEITFEIVDEDPKYNEDGLYLYGELYEGDEDDLYGEDGYNLSVDTYNVTKITPEKADEIANIIGNYKDLFLKY